MDKYNFPPAISPALDEFLEAHDTAHMTESERKWLETYDEYLVWRGLLKDPP